MKRRKQSYEAAFKGSLAAALARLNQRVPEAEVCRLCNRLERLHAPHVDLWLANTPPCKLPDIAHELLARCRHNLLVDDPSASLARAQLALLVAEASLEQSSLPTLSQDQVAEALGWVANALRRQEKYAGARYSWSLSFRRLTLGSHDPLLRADLLFRRSSLNIDVGDFQQARLDLAEAEESFYQLGEAHEAARARLQLGRAELYAGHAHLGFKAYTAALRDLDPEREPLLRLFAMEGSLFALVEMGATWLAFGLSDAAEPFFEELAPVPVLRRFRWLRGRLLGINGYLHEARTYLESVRLELIEAGQLVDASVCALDLASVYAGLRKPDTQRALAEEMLPIFNSAGLEREALAAVLVYVDAARNYRASRELMKSVLAKIDPFRKPKPKGRIDGAGEG